MLVSLVNCKHFMFLGAPKYSTGGIHRHRPKPYASESRMAVILFHGYQASSGSQACCAASAAACLPGAAPVIPAACCTATAGAAPQPACCTAVGRGRRGHAQRGQVAAALRHSRRGREPVKGGELHAAALPGSGVPPVGGAVAAAPGLGLRAIGETGAR